MHIDIPLEQLKISVSKTKTFKDCKKKFKYRYIEKLKPKDWEHLIYGKLVHKALEDFHRFILEGSTEKHTVLMKQALINALQEFKGKFSKEMKLEAWEYLNFYLKLINNNLPNVIAVEEAFDINFENNINLIGYIDRIQIDPDGIIHVIDYKTSKSDKYLKGDSFQLLVYAYILLLKNPELEKIRGSYMMIRDNFNLVGEELHKPFEFEKEQILDIKNKFLDYAVDIRSESEFLATPTFLCNYCDYQEICPEGKSKAFNKQVYGEVCW